MNKNNRLIIYPILLFLGIIFLLSNDIGVIKWYKLNKKRNNIKNTISNLKNQESILKNEINKLQTDSNYIKILAQEKFYMVKKGEKVFRVINKTSNE